MNSEQQKKETERVHLNHFLWAFRQVTAEEVFDIIDNETPDFIGRDTRGRRVGIELTRLKFDPRDMSHRRIIEGEEWADDEDVFWELLRLIDTKSRKLAAKSWSGCDRKILVIVLEDVPIESFVHTTDTDEPDDAGFDEIWLADATKLDAFYGFDLLPIVHSSLSGIFPVASKDRKPFG